MRGALSAPQSDKGAKKDDVTEHDDERENEVKQREAAAQRKGACDARACVAQTRANGRGAVACARTTQRRRR